MMTFSNFLAYYIYPTSTTLIQDVAQTFASDEGIIVEIKKENKYSSCKYFNCSWISSFSNESECLFFGNEMPVIINNITIIATQRVIYLLYMH